jgi:hypothetical protein
MDHIQQLAPSDITSSGIHVEPCAKLIPKLGGTLHWEGMQPVLAADTSSQDVPLGKSFTQSCCVLSQTISYCEHWLSLVHLFVCRRINNALAKRRHMMKYIVRHEVNATDECAMQAFVATFKDPARVGVAYVWQCRPG